MGLLRNAIIDGDVDEGSLMAGQSVGLMKDIKPMKQIVQDLVRETSQGLEKAAELIRKFSE